MSTAVATAYLVTCPRCKALRSFAMSDNVTGRCSGCEWTFTLGTPAVNAPAVPASTVNATNNSGTVVAVTISGGTLTAVTVNGTQVGTTAGTYLVPVAGTINITYTVAPAWTWALPQISAAVAVGATALPVASGGTYFTSGMKLLVDTGQNAEVLTVAAGATATSIPVTTAAVWAHAINAVFGNLLISSTYSGAGQEQVPNAPGWGY